MVTIADVAQEAGVSVATVSRVLNHKTMVSPNTVRRVEEAIRKLEYEPNLMARNFRKSESRVVLVLAPNITNPYYSQVLSGIGAAARDFGYSCMLCTTGGHEDPEREFLEMLTKKRADGAILLATGLPQPEIEACARSFPIVQCSEFYPGTTVAHVSIDNYSGARRMMGHLLESGHRRIATISSVNDYLSTRLRLQAWRDALEEAGIRPREEWVRRGSADYSLASGFDAAGSLLDLDDPPSAIFCISDTLALGAISAAMGRGLEVPADVSVVGFDDLDLATFVRPHITTIAQPCDEIGRRGMELLLQLIHQDPNANREVQLEGSLVIRQSSAPRG